MSEPRPLASTYQMPWAKGYDFSSAVRSGDLIFVSGQSGHADDGSLSDDFETQLRQAFINLDRVLRAQGGSLGSIVRLTTYFARAQDYAIFKRVRPEVLAAPFPASTGVVTGLVIPGMLVELEAVAVRGGPRALDPDSGEP